MPHQNPLAAIHARALARGGVIDLSSRAKWRLSGADRVRYLNGQTTNDIRRAQPGATLLACVTTAKGKLSGVIHVSEGSDFLRLDAEPELREPLAARLERYIIADDVTLEDVTETEALFHLLPGSDFAEPVTIAGLTLETRSANRFGRPGIDILANGEAHGEILAALAGEHEFIPWELAESLRIEAGIPRWGAELSEETLPPEAGLDETAIDYHKGCYIGQEVISRIKSGGHVNKHLARFTADAPLAPAMTLHLAEEQAESAKPAGEITSAAWSFGLDTWAALGYLKRGFTTGPLIARAADGAIVPVQVR